MKFEARKWWLWQINKWIKQKKIIIITFEYRQNERRKKEIENQSNKYQKKIFVQMCFSSKLWISIKTINECCAMVCGYEAATATGVEMLLIEFSFLKPDKYYL